MAVGHGRFLPTHGMMIIVNTDLMINIGFREKQEQKCSELGGGTSKLKEIGTNLMAWILRTYLNQFTIQFAKYSF